MDKPGQGRGQQLASLAELRRHKVPLWRAILLGHPDLDNVGGRQISVESICGHQLQHHGSVTGIFSRCPIGDRIGSVGGRIGRKVLESTEGLRSQHRDQNHASVGIPYLQDRKTERLVLASRQHDRISVRPHRRTVLGIRTQSKANLARRSVGCERNRHTVTGDLGDSERHPVRAQRLSHLIRSPIDACGDRVDRQRIQIRDSQRTTDSDGRIGEPVGSLDVAGDDGDSQGFTDEIGLVGDGIDDGRIVHRRHRDGIAHHIGLAGHDGLDLEDVVGLETGSRIRSAHPVPLGAQLDSRRQWAGRQTELHWSSVAHTNRVDGPRAGRHRMLGPSRHLRTHRHKIGNHRQVERDVRKGSSGIGGHHGHPADRLHRELLGREHENARTRAVGHNDLWDIAGHIQRLDGHIRVADRDLHAPGPPSHSGLDRRECREDDRRLIRFDHRHPGRKRLSDSSHGPGEFDHVFGTSLSFIRRPAERPIRTQGQTRGNGPRQCIAGRGRIGVSQTQVRSVCRTIVRPQVRVLQCQISGLGAIQRSDIAHPGRLILVTDIHQKRSRCPSNAGDEIATEHRQSPHRRSQWQGQRSLGHQLAARQRQDLKPPALW